MYLNPGRVAGALRRNELSERAKAGYLLAGVLLNGVLGSTSIVQALTIWGLAYSTASLLLTVIGTWMCFRANARGDNRLFVERYICVGFPILVQVYLVYLLLFYCAYAAFTLTGSVDGSDFSRLSRPYTAAAWTAVLLVYFVRLHHHVRWLASPEVSEPERPA